MRRRPLLVVALLLLPCTVPGASAQGTAADYQRAMTLRDRYAPLAPGIVDQVGWIESSHRFWFRTTVEGGTQFFVFDADTRARQPAFDHARLAAALSSATGGTYTALELPFNTLTFLDEHKTLEITLGRMPGVDVPETAAGPWRCALDTYTCSRPPDWEPRPRGVGGLAGPIRPPFDINGAAAKKSPDGKREAFVQQLQRRHPERRKPRRHDAEHRRIRRGILRPRVARLVAGLVDDCRLQGDARVSAVRALRRVLARGSAPAEGLHDAVRQTGRRAGRRTARPLSRPRRGSLARRRYGALPECLRHVAARVAEGRPRTDLRVQPARSSGVPRDRGGRRTGRARALISEEPKTFFCYSGKKYRHDVDDGREIVWMSERDGWNHLYLYDGVTAR